MTAEQNKTDLTVEVVTPRSAWLGALTYHTPQPVPPGSFVKIPHGKTETWGLVVAAGRTPEHATKTIIKPGPEKIVSPTMLQLDEWVTDRWFDPGRRQTVRLLPKQLWADPTRLSPPTNQLQPETWVGTPTRQYIAAPPSHQLIDIIHQLTQNQKGQTMIVCPSRWSVEQTLKKIPGSTRLKPNDPTDWAAWRTGRTRIGVATRSTIWWEAAEMSAAIIYDPEHPGHTHPKQPQVDNNLYLTHRVPQHHGELHLVGRVPNPERFGNRVKLTEPDSHNGPRITGITPRNLNTARNMAANTKTVTAVYVGERPGGQICPKCRKPTNRCSHKTRNSIPVGWDKTRVQNWVTRSNLPHVKITRLDQLTKPSDLTILFGAWAGGSDHPEIFTLRRIRKAAAATQQRLIVITEPEKKIRALLQHKKVRDTVVAGWETAKEDRLPPFAETWKISGTYRGNRTPNLKNLTGDIYGPRQIGNRWELLIVCDSTQNRNWVREQRRNGWRIKVEPA